MGPGQPAPQLRVDTSGQHARTPVPLLLRSAARCGLLRHLHRIHLGAFAQVAGVGDDGIALLKAAEDFEAVAVIAAGVDFLQVDVVVGADGIHSVARGLLAAGEQGE